MAKIEETRTYPGKTPGDCFSAAVRAYPKVGFNVWKKRELAWLALAKCTLEGKEVDSNLSARPGNPTPATLNLSADGLSEEALKGLADKFFQALEEELH